LGEAHDCATELRENVWEFGLELPALEATGLSHSQLRWLVFRGYVRQAAETTTVRSRHRTFSAVGSLTLAPGSCFILTAAGIDLLLQLTNNPSPGTPLSSRKREASDPSKPSWFADRQELRLGKDLIKKYRRPAPSQTTILAAFEEEGWPCRIDNP